MEKGGLFEFFTEFIENKRIFNNKEVLLHNFIPKNVFHRDEQIKELAKILAPILRKEKASNVFLYGTSGTGKTLTTKYTTQQMIEIAKQKDIPLKVIYINCKIKKTADTEYRVLSSILKEYGKEIPFTGLPTDDVYSQFYKILNDEEHCLLLILDEIDELIKKTGDDFLYNLTRIELKKTKISVIGISNDLNLIDRLDSRVKSSLSEEEIVFPPYDAEEIFNILSERAKTAFKENIIEESTILKCAAFSAKNHGDVRKAIDLLRVAGELAEREKAEKVFIEHIDKAEEKMEKDKIIDVVERQPLQYQIVLQSILSIWRNKATSTGEIYSIYENICRKTNNRPLTQRRVSDIIADFDTQGLIKAEVISKGRYGRTREIKVSIPPLLVSKIKEKLNQKIEL
jgi:archaeal cell division control protein 6